MEPAGIQSLEMSKSDAVETKIRERAESRSASGA